MRGKMNLNMEDLGMVAGGRMGHRSSADVKASLRKYFCDGLESHGRHEFAFVPIDDDGLLCSNVPMIEKCTKCGYVREE